MRHRLALDRSVLMLSSRAHWSRAEVLALPIRHLVHYVDLVVNG